MTDTVLASVLRSSLSSVLTAFHREGYGRVIRVLDPARAPVVDQLLRAGVIGSRFESIDFAGTVLVFVHAPERTTQAASLAVAHGAGVVDIVLCGNSATGRCVPALVEVADVRRERRGAIRTARSGKFARLATADYPERTTFDGPEPDSTVTTTPALAHVAPF